MAGHGAHDHDIRRSGMDEATARDLPGRDDNRAAGVVRTAIPARLDRLPWARFHWMIIVGLGTVWILDGLEVTMVGAVGSRLTEDGSGIALSSADIGTAAAIYVLGACVGALFFGQLTDRFGRRKLFILTLGVYITATTLTAFSWTPWFFFLTRFFTGAGIGGEYAAINSAVDELIPARVRGRVDLIINGTYWAGSAAGSGLTVFFLSEHYFAADVGWRLSFGLGALLGLVILIVRRHVPESPRWLFIHGQADEAERIVGDIETSVEADTGQPLPPATSSITVRQRQVIPLRTIAETAFRTYPRRAVLGLALFIGQAFLYNAFTFDLGTMLTTFYDVKSSAVPVFLVVYALGNCAGPLLLGPLFDTVGRKPMIAGTYLAAAAFGVVLAVLFHSGALTAWTFLAVVAVTFFFASAGASAAYLTVSEIFPMETRALAIAFFYAIGTGIGGIAGSLLFGHLIDTGRTGPVMVGFLIGAAVMAIGGVAELLLGVDAAGRSLEEIAAPLTTTRNTNEANTADTDTADTDTAGTDTAAMGSRAVAPRGGHASGHGACPPQEAPASHQGDRPGRLPAGD
ncbi:MFS transporter [Frankia sp. Ag45/Mut15]|uniref:MFS transporter n=2 Tax=Frankia umida TaxID=573489 RepID=A0ABT0K4N4_9ACTN|nr:MFS transporter [Frankia umida]MCK9878759.1 MFS transporter [Frankia umida]